MENSPPRIWTRSFIPTNPTDDPEAEGFMTVLDKHDAIRKVGSVGVPAPFMEMRILDVQGKECAPGEVGAGHASVSFDVPEDPTLVGRRYRVQWCVVDPAVPGSLALSDWGELEVEP